MTKLTKLERHFIETGGAIWCINLTADTSWSVYKVTWEYVDTLTIRVTTEEAATQWAYLLADLAMPEEKITLHHQIKRRFSDQKYPCLSDDYLDLPQIEPGNGTECKSPLIETVCRFLFGSKNRSLSAFRFNRQFFNSSHFPFHRD